MAKRSLSKVAEQVPLLETKVRDLLKLLTEMKVGEGQSFDVRKLIKGTDSSSANIISRIVVALGMMEDFTNGSRADLVPRSAINALVTSMADLRERIEEISTTIQSQIVKQGEFQSFDYASFQGVTAAGYSHNLQSPLASIFNASEEFLQRFFDVLVILKPRGAPSFQAAAKSLDSIIATAAETLAEAQLAYAGIKKSQDDLGSILDGVADGTEEIERLKSLSEADRRTIAEYLAGATEQQKAIDKVHSQAHALGELVEDYQVQFDRFQKQLEERENKLASGNSELETLLKALAEKHEDVEELINRSQEMLSSATVAGLASNFNSMTEKLTKELWWARFAFYVGILFLTISALPLLAFVLLPILATFIEGYSTEMLVTAMQYGPSGAQNGWQYLGQVAARVAILLPAAWFVSFTAIRHSSLFRLREHYAYKYSMAVSVEGFKKQAPEYAQEIAAMVLEQLAFNPADKLVPSKDVKEGKAPAMAAFLLEKVRSRLDKEVAVPAKDKS